MATVFYLPLLVSPKPEVMEIHVEAHPSNPRPQTPSLRNDKNTHISKRNANIDRVLYPDILHTAQRSYDADTLWSDLIQHGKSIMQSTNKPLTVIEVGVHNAKQCVMAAREKIHAHCFEPSPRSFQRIRDQIMNNKDVYRDKEVMKHLHLYNVAASDASGAELEFHTTNGSTGDHVGKIDMFHMKIGSMPDHFPEEKRGKIINVPTAKIDDFVLRNQMRPDSVDRIGQKDDLQEIDDIFAIKVDTQGFEPKVLAGMKESIEQHKFQHILLEYWPKGMELIASIDGVSSKNKCDIAVDVLDMLFDADYKLYALPIHAHPAQILSKEDHRAITNREDQPLTDFRAYCMYLREKLETRLPVVECKVGTWSDVLAVAPNVRSFLKMPQIELKGIAK